MTGSRSYSNIVGSLGIPVGIRIYEDTLRLGRNAFEGEARRACKHGLCYGDIIIVIARCEHASDNAEKREYVYIEFLHNIKSIES